MTPTDAPLIADSTTWDRECAEAMRLQIAGQLDGAEQIYRLILAAAPQHAAANYCLGMLQVQSRRTLDGLPHLKAALLAQLEVPDYWLGYLEALLLAGRPTAARNILMLGRQHGLSGDAAADFARRLEAHCDASLPPSKAHDAASERPAPRRAKNRGRRTSDIAALHQEARLLSLVRDNREPQVIQLARRLTQRFPERGLGWKILGAFMASGTEYAAALPMLETAVRLLPDDAEAHVNLGVTLAQIDRLAEAKRCLLNALQLDPTMASAHFRLGMILELQGHYSEAAASLRRGRELQIRTGVVTGDDELSRSHLLFLMSHDPGIRADVLRAEHRAYGEHVAGRFGAVRIAHRNDPTADRRLKVGFVSGDLYEHSVGQFFDLVAAQLAHRSDLELHAYYNHTAEDALNRRLRTRFKCWTQVHALSDDAMTAKIVQDGIDVLVDLSGHTGRNRLPVFARRPAPVQASWLGYPGSTGLHAMDYYMADRHWLPPGRFDESFTERLVYLPDRWAFRPHPHAPPVGPLPAAATGRMTFGSFHRLGKINPATLELWSRVLLAIPEARLLILGVPVDGPDRKLLSELASHGIDPDRLTIHGRSTMDVYLAFHNQVDVALDTLAYSGATTTMHSLSMGVPTLTIAGDTPQSRAAAGILGNAGLEAFVAADAAEFVRTACHWSQHLEELAALRRELRPRLDGLPMGQPTLIAAHVAGALREMWGRWCKGQPPASFASQAALTSALLVRTDDVIPGLKSDALA